MNDRPLFVACIRIGNHLVHVQLEKGVSTYKIAGFLHSFDAVVATVDIGRGLRCHDGVGIVSCRDLLQIMLPLCVASARCDEEIEGITIKDDFTESTVGMLLKGDDRWSDFREWDEGIGSAVKATVRSFYNRY